MSDFRFDYRHAWLCLKMLLGDLCFYAKMVANAHVISNMVKELKEDKLFVEFLIVKMSNVTVRMCDQ
jgi:hypothetical protein